jgi:hypothetical protein
MATFKSVANLAPVRVAYVQTAAAGTAPDGAIFVNPASSGEVFEIVEVSYVYDVVGGASAAFDIKITPSGTAFASGTTALSGTAPDLTATARTPRKATLTTTIAARQVKGGDTLVVDTSGTLTGLTGLVVLVTLKPLAVRKTH